MNQNPTTQAVDSVPESDLGLVTDFVAQTAGLPLLAFRQQQGQSSTHRNEVSLFAALSSKSGQWRLSRLVRPEQQSGHLVLA